MRTYQSREKKPRVNEVNELAVRIVWDNCHTAKIKIPGMIDNYNHYMLSADIMDQLIAYY